MARDMIFYTAHEMQILRTDTFYKRNPHWPSQPRVPASHPDGGQWTDGGVHQKKPTIISGSGLDLIKSFEKLSLNVYIDLAGHPTIGCGHKLLPGEKFPKGISTRKAEEILKQDVQDAKKLLLQWSK